MLGIIISLTGGIMAAASLIIKLKPDSKELIEKITPFQGVVGLVLLAWAIYSIIGLIRVLTHGVFDVMSVATVAVMLIVGFLLSFGLLSKFLFSKSEAAKRKGEAIRTKLAAYQGILGLVLIVLSVLSLIRSI